MDEQKRQISTTTTGKPPVPGLESAGAPQPINESGQHGAYWVLTNEERSKGFVRPVRRSYRHVGPPAPSNPLRDLTEEEHERYDRFGYVRYEKYPDGSATTGRYWTHEQLDAAGNGCGMVTTISLPIAETYARDPQYYGSTFCSGCHRHLPVGKFGEFVWVDGKQLPDVGVGESRVGT